MIQTQHRSQSSFIKLSASALKIKDAHRNKREALLARIPAPLAALTPLNGAEKPHLPRR